MNKATGLDQIPARALKVGASVVSQPLTHILNSSLSLGIFPDNWKLAKVVPIYKSDDRSDRGNYRPISILSVVSKIFEKLVFSQLYKYLSENNLLSAHQSGFRPGHSTVTALLKATTVDIGDLNLAVFLNLKKAFDTVDHDILLNKLKCLGVSNIENDWVKSYLVDRSQRCYGNGVLSNSREVKCGVPQGSNLGPLLFLVYINDLPGCLRESIPNLYADDTSITYSNSDMNIIEDKLNADLERLHVWLRSNRLSLNVVKSEYVAIASRNRLNNLSSDPVVTIGNARLTRVKETKSLGVIIDENLNWGPHIKAITKKVSKGLGALRRIRDLVPKDTLNTVYQSIVQPHFEYCSPVWDTCGKVLRDSLQRLQNRAARVITRSGYEIRSSVLIHNLGWQTLQEQQRKSKIRIMHKILKGHAPDYLLKSFRKVSKVHSHDTRGSVSCLRPPKPNTEFLKRSFAYIGIVTWNDSL